VYLFRSPQGIIDVCVRYLCVDAQRRRPLAPPSECFARAGKVSFSRAVHC